MNARRRFLLTALALAGGACTPVAPNAAGACAPAAPTPGAAPAGTPEDNAADARQIWQTLAEEYAYLDDRAAGWPAVLAYHQERARRAASRDAFIAVLEAMIDELYDPHANLGTNTPRSYRLVPSGADLWAEIAGERAIITEVRGGSAAERAGMRAGDEVLAIGGLPTAAAIEARAPRPGSARDPAARGYLLRQLLAGRHDEPRRFTIRGAAGERQVIIAEEPFTQPRAPLEARTLAGGVGYVRIHDTLGDDALVPAFDGAIAQLAGTRALVLDLRDTASGGNTGVAEAILGRFIRAPAPYQRYVLPNAGYQGRARTWVQYVEPRGPSSYDGRLVALVDHWTGSMGEGMAIGLDGMGRATLVGTAMAGLRGATHSDKLGKSGIGFAFPGERLFHVNGTPRERFAPGVLVDPRGQDGPGRDPILDRALSLIASSAP